MQECDWYDSAVIGWCKTISLPRIVISRVEKRAGRSGEAQGGMGSAVNLAFALVIVESCSVRPEQTLDAAEANPETSQPSPWRWCLPDTG